MIDHLANEAVTPITLPVAGFTAALTLTDRVTSIRLNLIEVTTGPVYFLFTTGAAPTLVSQMHALPAGAIERQDASGVTGGVLYVHAPGTVGTLKLVETT